MPAQLKTSQHGQTLVLTISNPEFRNALGPEIYAAATEVLHAAESNPDVRVIVITGEGENFCAGGNLNRILNNREQPPEVQHESIGNLHAWIETIKHYPKPIIAAVEGAAAGAGFSLVLACDFVVAASNAIFVMAYSTVGLSPDGGATWHLNRKLPANLALEWLMLGERQNTEKLHAFGLVNVVTQPAGALQGALDMASKLANRAPNVVESLKEMSQHALNADLHTQLDTERMHFVKNVRHTNGEEGIRAFLEKRNANYQ